MQICSADSYECGFDFDLPFAAFGSCDVIFDLDVLFAIEAGRSHGFGVGICFDLSRERHLVLTICWRAEIL